MSGEPEPGVGATDEPAGGPAFGWWPSPWSVSTVAAGKVSRGGLQYDGDSVYWSESRPELGGRQVVVRCRPGGQPADVSPEGVSVRSRVHEYGGGAATVAGATLFYVDQGDQRWYRATVDGTSTPTTPTALTPAAPAGTSLRYGDGRLSGSGRWLLSVEEKTSGGTTGHRVVAVAVGGSLSVVPLIDDGDFVTAPRPSPDGRWLAWMTWDHPSMPWDSSEIRLARLDETDDSVRIRGGRRVAGGPGISVGQPWWTRAGSLVFVDDRSGWWTPHLLAPEQLAGAGKAVALVDVASEFHTPDWVLGQSTMAEAGDGSLVCRMHADGRDQMVRLQRPAAGQRYWTIDVVDQPCVSIAGLVVTGAGDGPVPERVCVLGSTPTEAQAVFELPPDGGFPARRLSARPPGGVSAADVSAARSFTAATPAGPVPGLFFAPANRRGSSPAGARPPLVVFCHGGPTSSAEVGFDPVVQFFTSRGLAVAVVDYRGSSGYGRAYRRALDGRWGEADIDDCAHYAHALEEAGLVDGRRMAIRGTSAGGLTALGALIRSRRFAGAAAWYGVTDLEALAADTHDFESRYIDSLVGPWPEAADTYRERSPIHHPERVSGQVLLLQGEDDPVVPASQSRRFADRLREQGIPCTLTVFAGESHGFRRADTIEASLGAELDFYRALFGEGAGGEPAGPPR